MLLLFWGGSLRTDELELFVLGLKKLLTFVLSHFFVVVLVLPNSDASKLLQNRSLCFIIIIFWILKPWVFQIFNRCSNLHYSFIFCINKINQTFHDQPSKPISRISFHICKWHNVDLFWNCPHFCFKKCDHTLYILLPSRQGRLSRLLSTWSHKHKERLDEQLVCSWHMLWFYVFHFNAQKS